jgi:hypothetical protein
MVAQNPAKQSIDNNRYDSDMNAFHDFICNALMGEVE